MILPDITTLEQCVDTLRCTKKALKHRCSCGAADSLRPHGCYYRKPDRHALPGQSLNPVKVLRFICSICRKTCSALPECIPPKRWYLWETQQLVIQAYLSGNSWNSISQKFKIARSTCRRWVQNLQDKFSIHADILRNVPGQLSEHLVHCFDVKSLWLSCLSKINLSRAMLLFHHSGIHIP